MFIFLLYTDLATGKEHLHPCQFLNLFSSACQVLHLQLYKKIELILLFPAASECCCTMKRPLKYLVPAPILSGMHLIILKRNITSSSLELVW